MLLTGLAEVALHASTTLDFARDILGRLPTATPTAVLSATPPPPETSINFNADEHAIEKGECTTLRWHVTGARVVRVLGKAVEFGVDQQPICQVACPGDPNQYGGTCEN